MSHSNESVCLTQKEPVRYTNKLIKKTTDTNYTEYLQLTKKNQILQSTKKTDRLTDAHSTVFMTFTTYHEDRVIDKLDV